jgi:4-aminobutyrate aminotransferase-like enzyme
MTHGEQLRHSPRVTQAIDTIVEEVRAASAQITDVRKPVAEFVEKYDQLMQRAADVRGRALLYPYIGSGLGNGALVELLDGSVKWDMIAGIGVHFFGHSDPEMVRAAAEGSFDDVVKHGNLQTNNDAFEFGEALLAQAKKHSRLAHCFVTTSGAMANENAIKICYQKHAPASRVIAFRDCFMGRSVTMSQIGDAAANRQGIPLSTLVDYFPFYDEAAAERMSKGKYIARCVAHLEELFHRYPQQHACFIFELIQGEGGFNVADREWLKALMECCRAHKVAVWDDEIQCFGRTTRMFAYEHFDLGELIDVFCVGKMTQACATLYTEEYNPKPGLLSGTFTGEAQGLRVGRRAIERLASGDYYGATGRIAKHHQAFVDQVRALATKHPAWFPKVTSGPTVAEVRDIVGGVGGMMRFTPFGGDKSKIMAACKACFEEGVVLFYCGHGPFHIRMLPPLGVMKLEDWPRVFACVERGLAKVGA